jgi:hypothetical protein
VMIFGAQADIEKNITNTQILINNNSDKMEFKKLLSGRADLNRRPPGHQILSQLIGYFNQAKLVSLFL